MTEYIWQHRLVFATQLTNDIDSWFWLPPVESIRKGDTGGLVVYLRDVVIMGLQQDGISLVPVDCSWLCRDEEDRWWVINNDNYLSLDNKRHVTLFPNKATQKQVLALMTMQKLKKEFESMSQEEQERLYEQYPEVFIKTSKF